MSLWSSGAVAAVFKDALLEEGTKLADVMFGKMGGAVVSERRTGGGEHHPEQVPQVALKQTNTSTDKRSGQKTGGLKWNCEASLPQGDCGAQPPCARRGFQKVSLAGTQEPQAGKRNRGRSLVLTGFVPPLSFFLSFSHELVPSVLQLSPCQWN